MKCKSTTKQYFKEHRHRQISDPARFKLMFTTSPVTKRADVVQGVIKSLC